MVSLLVTSWLLAGMVYVEVRSRWPMLISPNLAAGVVPPPIHAGGMTGLELAILASLPETEHFLRAW